MRDQEEASNDVSWVENYETRYFESLPEGNWGQIPEHPVLRAILGQGIIEARWQMVQNGPPGGT